LEPELQTWNVVGGWVVLLVMLTAIGAAVFGFWFGKKSARPAARSRREEQSQWAPDNPRRLLTDKLLDLDTIKVDDIMIPRSEIASIDISDDWDTILDTLRSTPHTRLPVCENNLDNIVGILHMKKVAHALARSDLSRERLLQLAREREGYFVPEGTTLSVQLLNFQRDRRRIALVVDEYGDIRGLVTLEDILEEIVGDFTSAPGALHQDIHRETDGSFVINGAISIRVLNRTLGWDLPTDGPRTLNGLILEYLETIPQPGTGLKLGNLSVEILQTADNTVKTARVRPIGLRIEEMASKGAA
jgi:Mg2+/Co2+ transporter CorB